ncbi:hypothetical protein J3E74DRAFT_475948 [Bipolaris maydis]|nr:hypothetical protein J3E74DRAFT_448378 [Bipolaris maydis]KAJ5058035.1 hypothetical protein J3E74DRAFT_475948 [Bipolaris maydis]
MFHFRNLFLLSLAAFVPNVHTASLPHLVSTANISPRATLEGNLINNTDFSNPTIAPWVSERGWFSTWQLTTQGCWPGQCIQVTGLDYRGYGQIFSQTVTVQAGKRYAAVINTVVDTPLTQCRVSMLWDGKEMLTYPSQRDWTSLARDMPVSTTTSEHTFGIRMTCVGVSGRPSWIKIDRIFLIPSWFK